MTAPVDDGGPAESATGETVARVEGVRHRFGDVAVLEDVSFDLEPGRVTALVGPNGSGKTTLLRIVAGLLAPTGGRVELPDRERAVGYLPQNPDFRPAFTVEETLRFYADLLAEAVDTDAALEQVGLVGARDRRVDALSGGMRRLLGLAQAVLGDPPLVLFDEPTGDLDPAMTRHIFDVVGDLAGSGTTVLLATHNLEGAAESDDVLVLDRGTVVASGPPEDLLAETGRDSLANAFLAIVGEGELTVRVDAGDTE